MALIERETNFVVVTLNLDFESAFIYVPLEAEKKKSLAVKCAVTSCLV